ncbi:MAG: lactonase family protein [Opitutaceae bacterium]
MKKILRAAGLSFILSAMAASLPAAQEEFFVFFGTYTNAKTGSKGIYRARLDGATGQLSAAELAVECRDPSFLAVHPNGKILYAIDESSDPAKRPGRGLAAYAITAKGGALKLLNEQSNGGPGPCHLVVDRAGKCVVVANYSGGSVAAVVLRPDGRLGEPGTVVQHAGSSVNPARQKEPHAHAIALSPDQRLVFAADLGIDLVMAYRLDAARAGLRPNEAAYAKMPPGSGPRHLAFHPNGNFLYVINELLCTMSVFAFDPARGILSDQQKLSTLPPGETLQPGYSTAELAVHPGGKFLFGSNRGHNSIVVYAVDATTGKLTHVENQSTQGKTPRHFALDPTGQWLLAENQDSGTVVVFAIDQKTGRLKPTGQSLAVPAPVSAVFVAVE